jgi:ANTAR domain-containing protein
MSTDERTKGELHRLHAGDGAPALRGLSSGERVGAPLLNRMRRLEQENAQLRQALSSRVAIEQAKGILAERHQLELDEAFELLRRTARSNRVRIHALAGAVIAARRVPGALDVDGNGLRLGSRVADVPGEVA